LNKSVIAIYLGKPPERPGGCEIYRINVPFMHLQEFGEWRVAWTYFVDIYDEVSKHGRNWLYNALGNYDLFVFPRGISPDRIGLQGVTDFFEILRLMGKKIIYEVDDDLTNRYRDFSSVGVRNMANIARQTDAVTVTTPYLAQLMRDETKRPQYVLPNTIDPDIWDAPVEYVGEPNITILLSGSTSHEKDWIVLKNVLPRIMENEYDYPVKLHIAGYTPDYLRNIPHSERIPGMPYQTYVNLVKDADIVLAPVDPKDKFNDSKSPIKVIEGMGATRVLSNGELGGAACIATRTPVYELAIKDKQNGLLVDHTEEAWYQAIDRMIREQEFRLSIQHSGGKWVWSHHNIHKEWVRWDKAYRKVLERPANKLVR
jgi:glycosyltransferase involved in cell wall biosynthesis